MILRNALLGTKRFQDCAPQLGAPPTTLTRRLQGLTEQGFFVRRVYEAHPRREEYARRERAGLHRLAPVARREGSVAAARFDAARPAVPA